MVLTRYFAKRFIAIAVTQIDDININGIDIELIKVSEILPMA